MKFCIDATGGTETTVLEGTRRAGAKQRTAEPVDAPGLRRLFGFFRVMMGGDCQEAPRGTNVVPRVTAAADLVVNPRPVERRYVRALSTS